MSRFKAPFHFLKISPLELINTPYPWRKFSEALKNSEIGYGGQHGPSSMPETPVSCQRHTSRDASAGSNPGPGAVNARYLPLLGWALFAFSLPLLPLVAQWSALVGI